MKASPKLLSRIFGISCLCVFILQFIADRFQFENDAVQAYLGTTLFALFFVLATLTFICLFLVFKKPIIKAIFLILAIIFGFTSLMNILFGSLLAGNPGDYLKIQSIQLENSTLEVYQTNCGATCNFGIVVDQATPFFFSIFKHVHVLEVYYPASDLKFEKTGPNQVRIVSEDIATSTFETEQTNPNVPNVGDVWNLQ